MSLPFFLYFIVNLFFSSLSPSVPIVTVHFNLASSTVWSTTFLCVYWPCFVFFTSFSLSPFCPPNPSFCFFCLFFKPLTLNLANWLHAPWPIVPSLLLSLLCYYYCNHLLPSTQPFFLPLTIIPNLEIPHHKLKTHTLHWHLFDTLIFILFYFIFLPWSTSPSSFFPPHPHISLHPLMLFKSFSSLHSLRPSCLSFLHGTVAFLWTSLPVACGHVPTPLHCPPLRSVSFPLSPVPSPLFWPPAPLLPPAVSKERYATLPLYSFRYVIILSSPFFITTVTWQGGHVLSHVVGFYLFLTTDGSSSEYRAMAGGGVCLRVCMTCFGCCGFVWEKYGENATKLQHFI